ncbi:SDR family oxidoreductase [uncultured Ruegeria sp.]|uniref:SDR family NAD(P)-dependent oxidoreductase n=1 Tax=uncultured Ruegeria sp. TaxID=259304 RepID=UPI0026344589|nr:SDR family oxidoreductase [uncultured Ruegeria sp.]
MLLKDKVVFVTGAASGIGAAGAIAMAREGADVTLADIDADAVTSVANRINAEGGIAHAIALDVGDDNDLTTAIDNCAARYGRLDVLHSHPGLQIAGTLEQVSVDDMDASWRLNVRSHFVAAKAAMAYMKPALRGSIIITASGSGVQYDREMIAYATTKHAAVAMARQIAKDFGKDNVRVNALCPGFIDTPFNRGFEIQMGGRDKLEYYIADEIPMGRFGTVGEMADAIVYLASDRSTFMTGHALVIDGGECL